MFRKVNHIYLWCEYKNSHYGKQHRDFFREIKTEMPYNQATPFLTISKGSISSTAYQKHTYEPMFVAVLCTTANKLKQIRSSLMNRQRNCDMHNEILSIYVKNISYHCSKLHMEWGDTGK